MQPFLQLQEENAHKPWYRSRRPWAIIAVTLAVIVVILAVVLSVVLKTGDQTKYFLHIADLHYDSTNRTCACTPPDTACCKIPCIHSAYGTYGAFGCDSPLTLINATMVALQQLETQPNFVVLCGDLSGHRSPSFDTTLSEVNTVRHMIGATFPDLLIIGVIGNDDVHPDYCVNTTWFDSLFPVWEESILCTKCEKYDPNNQATWSLGGFYDIWPEPGLRVFALNTLYFAVEFAKDCKNLSNFTIGATQMQWLANGLAEAQAAGDNVYIVGHIVMGQQVFQNPPGVVQSTILWETSYLQQYAALIAQYAPIIKSQLFAHVHRDEFKLMRQDFTSASSPIIAPVLATSAVSPVFDNNPSFRMYSYETESHNLQDYRVHYFDLIGNNVGRVSGYDFLYQFSDKWGSITASADGSPLGASAMTLLSESISGSLINMTTYLSLRNVMFFLSRYDFSCSMQYLDPGLFQQCLNAGGGEVVG